MLIKKRDLKRTIRIGSYFNGLLKPNEKVLDVGLWHGLVAKHIQDKFKVHIEGIDIIDYNTTEIKNTIYDGLHFPFEDNSFDIVIILATLHHCKDFIQILKEAKRVTKQKIIILEAVYDNKFELFLIIFRELIGNKMKGMLTPLNFCSKAVWRKHFDNLHLKIEKENNYLSKFFKIFNKKRVVFVLTK